MTEKYILREAVRDVITDTVYRRQKHPFLSPPATLNPAGDLHALMQDTLRGPAGAAIPFLDQAPGDRAARQRRRQATSISVTASCSIRRSPWH